MENIENYYVLSDRKIGNARTRILIKEKPTVEQHRKFLIKLYDCINEIAEEKERKGEDMSRWFYTKEQIEELKKDPKIKFI